MTNKEIVTAVNDAFSSNNMDAFYDLCTDNIQWTMMGKFKVEGKDALRKAMTDDTWNSPQLITEAITSEDDRATCTGTMHMTKKVGEERYDGAFCDVYTFRDGKIATLTAYMIDIPAPGSNGM